LIHRKINLKAEKYCCS